MPRQEAILRPISLVSQSTPSPAADWVDLTAGAIVAARLADNTDTTGVKAGATMSANYVLAATFGTFSFPGTAKILSVTFLARGAEAGSGSYYAPAAYGRIGSGPYGFSSNAAALAAFFAYRLDTFPAAWVAKDPVSGVPLTAALAVGGVPLTAADVNAWTVQYWITTAADAAAQVALTELYLSVLYDSPPTGTFSAPLSASVQPLTRPPAGWVYVDADADPQASFQFAAFTAAQAAIGGFDPAVSPALFRTEVFSSANSYVPTVDLPDGATVYYLRVADSVVGYGAWASDSFTITAARPAVPTVVPTLDLPNARISLAIQGYCNALTWNQGSVEDVVTTGFVARTNSTLNTASLGGFPFEGNVALSVKSVASGTASASTTTGTGGAPVVAGKTYHGVASCRSPVGARTCRMAMEWYNAAGTLLSTSFSAASSNGGGTGAAYDTGAVTAPAGAVTADLYFETQGTAGANELSYWDKFGILPAGAAWSPGGFVASQTIKVESSDDSGTTWKEIRQSPAALDGYQQATILDPESRAGVARIYRATALSVNTQGSILASTPSSSTSPLTVTIVRSWLKDTLDPTKNLALLIDDKETDKAEPLGIFDPYGRAYPIVSADLIHAGWDGQFRISVRANVESFAAVEALIASQNVLLYQQRPVVPGGIADHKYVRLVKRHRTRIGRDGARIYPLDYVEMDGT